MYSKYLIDRRMELHLVIKTYLLLYVSQNKTGLEMIMVSSGSIDIDIDGQNAS